MEPAEKGQVPRRGFAPLPSVSLLTPYGPGRFKGTVVSPLIVPTSPMNRPLRARAPTGSCAFAAAPYCGGSYLTPAKWQNTRRLVFAKASHPHTNRRGRLVPPEAASASWVQFPQTRRSVRPFQAPRTRLRLEAAFGGRYWRAARAVPGTAIGPASKFRPDRCRRLLRPPLAGHAPCFIGPPALQKSAPEYRRLHPLRGLRSLY